MTAPLLSIRDLSVAFGQGARQVLAVDRVSFDIGKGETVVEYRGRRIPTRLAQELDRRRANKYLFEIDRRWTIDG